MKKKLKLGVIDVLNVLPVYYSILSGEVSTPCEIIHGKVTELNTKLNCGRIDISVISSFEYATNPDLYYIFPQLSVGADGPVRSIYLFLDKPLEQLAGDTIKLTEFSLTSVHLIQYLLKNHNVTFTQTATHDFSGELLIADEAIRRYYQKSDPFVYDLSDLWRKNTGLPFVFALWVVRKDVFEKHPEDVLETYQALIQSRKKSRNLYKEIAEKKYKGIFPAPDKCEEYLKNIHYDFSSEFVKGFHLFQEKMVEIKKLDQIAPISFIPEC